MNAPEMHNRSRLALLGYLPLAWYVIFLLGPLVLVFAMSFALKGVYGGILWQPTFENFQRAMDPLYARIFLRSLWLAAMNAALCFAIGFPVALAMATAGARVRQLCIFLLAIPFLTNLIIRICALRAITATDGALEHVLTLLHVPHDPFALSQNAPLVFYGLVSTYLPFMVFPLYGALERFDFSLVEAAQDLGARDYQVMTQVLMPGLRQAISSALLLVFIPSLGEFVIPDLLGGAKVMLGGNLISEEFLKSRDWPFGAALSVILILILTASVIALRLWGGRRER